MRPRKRMIEVFMKIDLGGGLGLRSELRGVDGVRRIDGGFGEVEFGFKLVDDFGSKEVLDHVGITVDVAWGNVGVFDEVEFPETVVAGDAGGFPES
jgi:hypothetical protein